MCWRALSIQAAGLADALAFSAEHHRIAVKDDPQAIAACVA